MTKAKLATTDYVSGEVAKRQEYFADVSVNEVTGNRELSLKDADGSVAGQIIAQKEGSVLFKNVATPNEATDGANKEYADDNFANALKGTASDVSIRVDDVSPVEHTLGVKISSKNMIPFYNRHGTATDNGITYTVDDLVITTNGTVTGNQSQYFLFSSQNLAQGVLNVNPAETFYISGCPEGGSASTYYLGVLLYKDTTNVATFKETGNGFLLYQPDVDYNRVLFKIYITKDITVNNLVFKPQMERGSTATPFTLYLPDVTTVTVTRCGKNLIQYPFSSTTSTNGITATYNDNGSVTLNGTASASAYFWTTLTSPYLEAGKTYAISGCPKGGSINTYALLGTQYAPLDIGEGATYTPDADGKKNLAIFVAKNTAVENLTFFPQIELGTVVTPYEPYRGQTYTPSADGTVSGVKSLYPTITLTTNNSGAIINAEYNRDINKAFAELQQAIISLGGNV